MSASDQPSSTDAKRGESGKLEQGEWQSQTNGMGVVRAVRRSTVLEHEDRLGLTPGCVAGFRLVPVGSAP